MKRTVAAAMLLLLAMAGCGQNADEQKVDDQVQAGDFFKSLAAVPGSDDYAGHVVGLDGDTSRPVKAWRSIHDPDVNYTITVQRPLSEVAFSLAWPCTLFVACTDLPDTSIRDTVAKPAPEINGAFDARFRFDGSEWQLDELTPCHAEFDSAAGLLRIDSLHVRVRRAGQVVEYPTLLVTARLPVTGYPYAFSSGDSIDLRLWETHDTRVALPWAYLHGPPTSNYQPFQPDTLNGSWVGSWTLNPIPSNNHSTWVWFEVVDLNSGVIEKHGPDRAVLWGLFYKVQ